VRFVEGNVQGVDVERQVVRLEGADGAMHELPFDHVVIALGASTNMRLIPGSEHARTFKTVADALLLRNHVIELLERASVERDPDERRALLTIVVIGGGLVGVELLGELTAFIEKELRYYPLVRRDELSFHLFEAGGRLLIESTEWVAAYAEEVLHGRGATVHTSTPVTAIEPDGIHWKDGSLSARTIVIAAGIVPNATAAATTVERDRRGRILTDPTLRSVSHRNVWALGDCAAIPSPDGGFYPALAQHAVREARVVARNVVKAIDDLETQPFRYESLGTMAAFGHTRAAVDLRGFEITGFIAWWMRRTYYLFQMPRWERRFRIALDWTVSLFVPPDLTKVDLADERERNQRHVAAGALPDRAPAEPIEPVLEVANSR
jgi:NADH dehydrogenase